MFVKIGADFLELVLQIVVGPFHRVDVVAIDRVANGRNGVFDLLLLVAGNLVAQLFQLLLGLIGKHVGVVLDLDCFLRLFVLFGVRFGFTLHFPDFLLRKSGAARDGNLLFLSCAEIFRAHVQNAVSIDVEGNFDLRNAARRRWNSIEMECAERFVVAAQRTFTLKHFDLHTRLIIAVSRKDLRFASWDRGVARNHGRSYAACGFNRQRQRGYVQQEHVFDFALEHAALNRRTDRNDFVRIHTLMWFLAN